MKTVVVLCLVALSAVQCALKDAATRPIQIVQLIPSNEHQLLRLIQLYETGDHDFWRAPTRVNATIDVMVNQQEKQLVQQLADKYGIKMLTIVKDLEQMIEEKEGLTNWRQKALDSLASGGKRDLASSGNGRKNDFGMDMTEYHGYDEIVSWMRRIERFLPSNCRVYSIGKTVENRDIYGIKIGNPVGDASKKVAWIDGGIHAREWTAVFTSTHLIYELANGIINRDQKLMKILQNVEIVVFPVLNPDGYEYTRSEPRNALVRMFRKNRSSPRCSKNRFGKETCCQGTDLNRNFDYKFAETGSSSHPCSEIYHGSGAFSEPETRAVRDAVLSSDLTGRIEAFVTLHAYSQLFIYPFSYKKHSYPADIAQLKKVAQKAVSAIGRLFGTHYLYGTGPEIIYAYTGGSSDWSKDTAKIKYSYTIELRPSYYSWNGFVLDKSQLVPTARETFDGIMVVLQTVSDEESDRRRGIIRPPPAPAAVALPPRFTTTPVPRTTTRFAGVCRDLPECGRWLLSNPTLCARSRAAMMRECPLTCGFC